MIAITAYPRFSRPTDMLTIHWAPSVAPQICATLGRLQSSSEFRLARRPNTGSS